MDFSKLDPDLFNRFTQHEDWTQSWQSSEQLYSLLKTWKWAKRCHVRPDRVKHCSAEDSQKDKTEQDANSSNKLHKKQKQATAVIHLPQCSNSNSVSNLEVKQRRDVLLHDNNIINVIKNFNVHWVKLHLTQRDDDDFVLRNDFPQTGFVGFIGWMVACHDIVLTSSSSSLTELSWISATLRMNDDNTVEMNVAFWMFFWLGRGMKADIETWMN